MGCGEARNKTSAQAIAAEGFVNFLKEKGLVSPESIPSLQAGPTARNTTSQSPGSAPPLLVGGAGYHAEPGPSGDVPPPLMGGAGYQGGAGPSGDVPPPLMGGAGPSGGAWDIEENHGSQPWRGAQPMGGSGYTGGAGPSAPPPSLTPAARFAIREAPPPSPAAKQGWF